MKWTKRGSSEQRVGKMLWINGRKWNTKTYCEIFFKYKQPIRNSYRDAIWCDEIFTGNLIENK